MYSGSVEQGFSAKWGECGGGEVGWVVLSWELLVHTMLKCYKKKGVSQRQEIGKSTEKHQVCDTDPFL